MIKAFVDAPMHLSRAMHRVSHALREHAPAHVRIVRTADEADLQVLHVVGYNDTVAYLHRQKPGQKFAIIQYCLKTTSATTVADWIPVWDRAALVWTYYDIAALATAEGVTVPTTVYCSPLGVDASVFRPFPGRRKPWIIGTSGYVPETECVREAASAASRVGLPMFHLGPDQRLAGVTCALGINDRTLARFWSECQFVAGLRRVEGFELPAAEGLLCGARPIMFDAPHYRMHFDGFAEFIQEGSYDEVVVALEDLFRRGARPVAEGERRAAAERFHWPTIAAGFWERAA